MKFMTKAFGWTMFLVVALLAMTVQTSAQSANYNIKEIYVNGLQVLNTGSGDINIDNLDVERGDLVNIQVVIDAADTITGGSIDDVRIEARIIGYEYGDIEDRTPLFSVDQGHIYTKNLRLQVPSDIDASQDYSLRIDVSDPVDDQEFDFLLKVDEQRHNINIFDVLLNPSSTIQAGKPLFITVRLENLGEKDEENIKVTASIPTLGVSTSNYIKELVSQQTEESEEFRDDEEAERQLDLLLRMPEDAASGVHDLLVTVDFQRGNDRVTETMKVNVIGAEVAEEVKTIINTDSTSKKSAPGQDVTYRLMVANLGTQPGLYSVQVDGVSSWGEVSVEPGFLNVLPQSTGEVLITIAPFSDEETASHTWVARVLLGNEILNEVTFNTNVQAPEVEEATTGTTLKNVLAIIFGILVVVLIILGLIIAFRRMEENEEETTEPGTPSVAEGQTYYYYPKK